MKARTVGIVAAAGLAALVGCESKREPTPPVFPPQVQPEQEPETPAQPITSQAPSCSCQCTISPDKIHAYLMGSDTRIEITKDYILANSKRVDETDKFIQYGFLYNLKNNTFTEKVYLFKRDGCLITYIDTDDTNSSHDGLVDKIEVTHLWGNERDYTMERNKDYEANKPMFDEADNILREAKETFRNYNSYHVPGHMVFGINFSPLTSF